MPAVPEPPNDFKEHWEDKETQELIRELETAPIPDVERPGDYVNPPLYEEQEDDESPEMKAAKARWKAENPHDTLKHQRFLHERGSIPELPWMKYLQIEADNVPKISTTTGFGIEFPGNPNKGDSFVRVDMLPTRLYKYNGNDWMSVDKNLSDSYTYDTAYIDHLIAKIESGEYDPDMLSDSEREQVTARLQGPK